MNNKINPKAPFQNKKIEKCKFKQIDLFAGIGGIRLAFQKQGGYNIFSSEIDKFAQKTYEINFGEKTNGDITQIEEKSIPDHDILLAGFPCQSFSIAGLCKGFEDTRGTMFFEIVRILKEKRPKAFMLENVKHLKSHDKGKTLEKILYFLKKLNYYVPEPEILNSYYFGVPQKRERIIILGFNKDYLPRSFKEFIFPKGNFNEKILLGKILEKDVDEIYTISDKLWQGHKRRKEEHQRKGNGFGYSLFNENSKYTNTLTARYYNDGSEILIEQKNKNPRKLTPRECARLQGFPEEFIIPVSNTSAYKQFGNSVCVPVIEAVAKAMIEYLENYKILKK